MQAFRSRTGSSDMQPKVSPNTTKSKGSLSHLRKGSSAPSNSVDFKPSKVSERKLPAKSHSFQEKQRTVRVSDTNEQWLQLEEELRKAREERSLALEELKELKNKNEDFIPYKAIIEQLELEAAKAKESEERMHDSLFSQTGLLEQAKVLLEEAKLEIKELKKSTQGTEKNASLASIEANGKIKYLRNELRLALEAEEKSKRAMDDLAIALKEVTAEAFQAKAELSSSKSLLGSAEQKLNDTLRELHVLKLEYEESALAWKEKEEGFIKCIRISEDDMNKKDQEISRLTDAHKIAREETSKLRDIIKQAVNESTVIKESLEIARYENRELEERISKKEIALQQIRRDYESIKVSEAAALDSVKELKSLLASVSAAGSNKPSKMPDAESLNQSKEMIDDRRINLSMKKFASERWSNLKSHAQNGRRNSVSELDVSKSLNLDKETYGIKDRRLGSVSNAAEIRNLSSLAFTDNKGLITNDFVPLYNDMDTEKKRKTALRKFGDALLRRSFRKA